MRIAFNARPYTGKSTLAKHLAVHYGFCVYSLAAAVREKLAAERNIDPQDILDSKAYYRADLHRIGEERRAIDPNYWINELLITMARSLDSGRNLVVDDLRFPAEAEALRDRGFILVRLDCSDSVRAERSGLTTGELHKLDHTNPESSLSNWDFDLSVSLPDGNFLKREIVLPLIAYAAMRDAYEQASAKSYTELVNGLVKGKMLRC